MITALDHVQVAMPAGGEREARHFYSDLLGLDELEKPAALAARGGAWFALPDGRQLHLGVEDPFRPSRKAHPAFVAPPGRVGGEDRGRRSARPVGRGVGAAAEVLWGGPFREQAGVPGAVAGWAGI